MDDSPCCVAKMLFLPNRRLQVPEDVSLICTDGDPHCARCRPAIALIYWYTACRKFGVVITA